MGRKVEVVAYDPAWPVMFQAEAERLAAVFASELIAIHHVGSTAVPGIKAKPIIDFLLVVQDIEKIDAYNNTMREAGYVCKGENGIAGRRYFRRGSDILHTDHIHVFQAGHPEIERHLDFRDYLRTHPQAAQAYSDLKEALAQQFPEDTAAYTEAKSSFVAAIVRKAKSWRGLADE